MALMETEKVRLMGSDENKRLFNFELEMDGNKVNVYDTLKNAIQFLYLKPGMVITEAELKETLGVSRTPIREALIRLSDEMLVDIYPQRGTYVSKINLELAREMAFMRHIVETEIFMDLCRKKANVSEIVAEALFFMKKALDKSNVVEYIKTDAMYHKAIFSFAGHSPIWKIINNTRMHYVRFLMLDMEYPDTMDESFRQHEEIAELMAAGEEEKLAALLEVHHDYKRLEEETDIMQKFPNILNRKRFFPAVRC